MHILRFGFTALTTDIFLATANMLSFVTSAQTLAQAILAATRFAGTFTESRQTASQLPSFLVLSQRLALRLPATWRSVQTSIFAATASTTDQRANK